MTYQSVNPFDGKRLMTFEELSNKQLETRIAAAACSTAGGGRSPSGRPWSHGLPPSCAHAGTSSPVR